MITLGIDTSNYTTSCAIINDGEIIQKKRLLPVKPGERGLRQSDALFHHTVALPELLSALFSDFNGKIDAVGCSTKPRNVNGSYMPCFLAGVSAAKAISCSGHIPMFSFSHQEGHILSALYSADRVDLLKKPFIAFHVSGGTTEMLYVTVDSGYSFDCQIIGKTLDLNFGQAIDRIGVKSGMNFPCGKQMEELALTSKAEFKIQPTLKENDCCVSGLENMCFAMLKDGTDIADVSKFCFCYVAKSIEMMTKKALLQFPNTPVLYAGGVMSNSIIKCYLSEIFDCVFALPEYSSDNAAGIAYGTYLKCR